MPLSELDRVALQEHAERRLREMQARNMEQIGRDTLQWSDIALLYDLTFFYRFELPMFQKAYDRSYDAKMVWDGDSPYLLRIYLTGQRKDVEQKKEAEGEAKKKSRLPSPFLHYFFRGDHERDIHNHPWEWAVSLILKNGYLEHVWDAAKKKLVTRSRRPGMLNFIRNSAAASTFHRVDLDRGNCWSLFLAGPKVDLPEGEGWGFLDEQTGEYETYNVRDAKNKAKWAAEREHRLDLS